MLSIFLDDGYSSINKIGKYLWEESDNQFQMVINCTKTIRKNDGIKNACVILISCVEKPSLGR